VTTTCTPSPDGWLAPRGYSNATSATGRMICIAGQVGWDPATRIIAGADFVQQTAQALRNVVSVLQSAGARPEHLMRMTWFITNRAAYIAAQSDIGSAYREIIGRHYPAMSVVIVQGLIEPDAAIEIEATAIVPE
jgi:enamine deaminase RidA (YjgF/YER057c/UK114 family)